MSEIITSVREMDLGGIAYMVGLCLAQIGAGVAIGAILWRPRKADARPVRTVLEKP